MKPTSSRAVDVFLIVAAIVMLFAIVLACAYAYLVAVPPPSPDLDRFTALSTATAAIGSFFAFVVLAVYTRETSLLRTAAERQLEVSIRPLLILEMSSLPAALGQPLALAPITVRNIGSGPAFNIRISDLIGDGIRVELTPRNSTCLRAGEQVEIEPLVFQDNILTGCAKWLSLLASMFENSHFSDSAEIVISFTNIINTQYAVTHKIRYDTNERNLELEIMTPIV